jgi:large subunit ribosomal protein L29
VKNSFKNLTYPELKTKRDELKRKFMEFRFKIVIGHVDNPLQKRTMRRQIAQLNTLIHAHELAEKKAAALSKSEGSSGRSNERLNVGAKK